MHVAMSVVTPNDFTVLTIRMRRQYRDYLRALAIRERCTVAAVVDRAVAEYSRKVRTTPPPRR
jgi:D-tyrosyl-tRNA(Tyr) deacylase